MSVTIDGRPVPTPEHDKLNKWTEQERDLLQEFLDWIVDRSGYTLCERSDGQYWPARCNRADLMAGFYGVDPRKFSDEKDELVRALQDKHQADDLEARYSALTKAGIK